MRIIGTLLLIFLTTSAFLACFAAVYIVNVILPQANMDLSSFNVDENSVMYYQDKSTGEYKELRQVLSVTNSQWVDYEDMPPVPQGRRRGHRGPPVLEAQRPWTGGVPPRRW